MKQNLLKMLFFILIVFSANSIFAQQSDLEKIIPQAYGTQYPLMVGTSRTTVLIFPSKIAVGGVDLGSADLIASNIASIDNILRVKASTENMEPTNLTVVTTDGKVYSFYVAFSPYPDDRPIDLGKQINAAKVQATLSARKLNDGQIKDCTAGIFHLQAFMKKPKTQSYGVALSLSGIYTKEDVLFFRFALKNKSPLDFTTDFMRFYIKDQHRIKRTADQELELQPLGIYPERSVSIPTGITQTFIVAFKRFTIADHKNMVIQLFEQNGDRHLHLNIKGKVLMQSRRL